ncbi:MULTISPECIES: hypothetical protein [Streptomyces]|uniref:HEPN domain-containing protein n=1 Tax=Streptomyces sudanensis TaxID=436397 RepID=A0ABY4TCH6_9ACTN|nr:MULTISPECIES: hypothetical protein [Streptomyces]URN16644.1 hypothetical protein MW084_12625 [Streptomyces sudanensis]
MVDVRVGQLRKSRDRLSTRGEEAAGEGDLSTAGLMLFYAAECGLKAEILVSVRARNTSALPENLRNHDLRALAKALGLSLAAAQAVQRCRRVMHGSLSGAGQRHEWVGPAELHQAWRYGADLDPDDEKRAVEALRHLVKASRA